jgi:F-type H+-transporting ATPase subunit b
MLPRVSSVVEERNNRIKADLGLAEKLKNDAEAALVNYNQLVADARSKAADIGKEMRQRLDVEAGKERARLKAEMAAKFSEAENWIAAAKAKALTCVEEIGPRWQVQSSPS